MELKRENQVLLFTMLVAGALERPMEDVHGDNTCSTPTNMHGKCGTVDTVT